MASNGNQPKQPDQSNKPQQGDRGQKDGGANRDNRDNKGGSGTERRDSRTANNPDVTIPNPKNPSYGDNEPGDPRRLEIDANNPPSSGKQNPRRS